MVADGGPIRDTNQDSAAARRARIEPSMEGLWSGRNATAAPKPEKQHLAQQKSMVFQIAASGTKDGVIKMGSE